MTSFLSIKKFLFIRSEIILPIFLLATFTSWSQSPPDAGIIPLPVSYKTTPGFFSLTNKTVITWDNDEDSSSANIFNKQLRKLYRFGITTSGHSDQPNDVIHLKRVFTDDLPPEGYKILVAENKISIHANSGAGIFYGLQTLLQLIARASSTMIMIQQCEITDYPRYAWRGMHLDVARHFFSKAEVKQYIDYLAAYKFNTFHWHLTDDQGWRIEIKKYPRLTEVGAWRDGTLIGHYSNDPKFDSIRYGGFYSQDHIKEIVAYAQKRFITIVPEIEMPGHALAALAAYPELSCSGNSFEVAKSWGVFNDVLCPTEETILFMQNVLAEVMQLFPSHYIHIGGDECPKEDWKASAYCQNLIKQLGLKDEVALQNYFTSRMEKFVRENGRSIIGWDEILEGGALSSDAAVMSWRGMEGGIAAASQQHAVVMAPTEFCYFDYYQSQNAREPLAIGGYIPLEKVYAFEPTPAALLVEKQTFILGGQANLWTEYIASFSQLQYMIFPRMCAMSEVLWSKNETRNFNSFTKRLTQSHFPLFETQKINYSKALLEVKMELRPNEKGAGVIVRLSSFDADATINYNLSSFEHEILSATNNTNFEKSPIDVLLNHSMLLNVISKDKYGTMGPEMVQQISVNYATGKKLTLTGEPDPKYNNGGPFTLVNGISARIPWNGSEWLGFSGKNLDAVLDLGETETISKITLGLLEDEGSWIYLPQQVSVSVSTDGKTFKTMGTKKSDAIKKSGGRNATFSITKTSARYIKIVAINNGIIPSGKAGAGHPAWLFADEISVE